MGNNLQTTLSPRIYVACLAAYNSGRLHGAWINAAQEPWSIYDDVKAMLAASPVAEAEEWAIHDYEGFGGVRICEYACFERVSALAAFISQHGEIGAALLDHYACNLEEAREAMQERYCGAHASLADYVQDATEETMSVPETLRFYVDYQAMARDAELSGDLFSIRTAHDVVHVFMGY